MQLGLRMRLMVAAVLCMLSFEQAHATRNRAYDIHGHWVNEHCRVSAHGGSVMSFLRFTESTVEVEQFVYSDTACKDRVWTEHYFGAYYIEGSVTKPFEIGSNTALDADKIFLGFSRHVLVPNSKTGENYLNGALSEMDHCNSRGILPVLLGKTTDLSFTSCPDMGWIPFWNCTTRHSLVHVDSNNHLYFARNPHKAHDLYSVCDASFFEKATFNHPDNCKAGTTDCETYMPYTKVSVPDVRGVWDLECVDIDYQVPGGTRTVSFNGHFAIRNGQQAGWEHHYSGAGCQDANFMHSIYQYGDVQISGMAGLQKFQVDFSVQERLIMSPTDSSTTALNALIKRNPLCEEELGTFKTGEFKVSTYSDCPALGLISQGRCPTRYSEMSYATPSGGADTMTWGVHDLTKNENPCAPGTMSLTAISRRRALTPDQVIDYIDFGTSMPPHLFDSSEQARANIYFFFDSYFHGNYSVVDYILTPDFSLVNHGDSNHDPSAGAWTATAGNKPHDALVRYYAHRKRFLKRLGFANFKALGANDRHASVMYTETVQNIRTGKIRDVGHLLVITFMDGKIQKMEYFSDSLAIAESGCDLPMQCGGGRNTIFNSTTYVAGNSTTIINNYHSETCSVSDATMNPPPPPVMPALTTSPQQTPQAGSGSANKREDLLVVEADDNGDDDSARTVHALLGVLAILVVVLAALLLLLVRRLSMLKGELDMSRARQPRQPRQAPAPKVTAKSEEPDVL